MNIILRELKAHRKSLIFWSIGMLFLIMSGMSKYSGYEKAGESVNDLMAGLPSGMKAVFGVGEIDLTTAIGFYAVMFLYFLVMTSIHASLLGAGIITKEEKGKTAEFLYAKPISRTKVITSKLVAAVIDVLVLNLVTLVLSVVIVSAYNKGESATGDILILMVGLFFVQLIFLSIGMAAAAIFKRYKRAAPAATGIMLFAFFLSLWLDMTDKFQNLKYLTPFKYFDAKVIIKEGSLDPVYIALSIGIVAVLLTTTYVFYQRRDLNI